MTTLIHIMRTPDGPGYSAIREPYVGCTFPLADPALVRETEQRLSLALDVPLAEAYSVTFADVIAGLAAAARSDWVDHLQGLIRPRLVRFPVGCAELIRA
jgi:hypothetical protein